MLSMVSAYYVVVNFFHTQIKTQNYFKQQIQLMCQFLTEFSFQKKF